MQPQKTNSDWINPSILTWRREKLGLTKKEVAALSKELKDYPEITEEELNDWENQKTEPELDHLETLSEIYVCPVGYFFLKEQPEEYLPLSYRGLAPEKQGKLSAVSNQTLYRFYDLAEWTAMRIEELGIQWKVKFESVNPNDNIDSIVGKEKERIGFNESIRKKWKNSNDAFEWWRKKIEDLGIFCFQMKLGLGEIRGSSLWLNSNYPFILVNHKDIETATGRIFTLLHEYAHLLTNKDGLVCDFRGATSGNNPEPFANKFAARMLLSYEEVENRLKKIDQFHYKTAWSDDLLNEIREPFFVSRDVVSIMLQEMDLAPKDFYQIKRKQWERKIPFGKGGGGKGGTQTRKESTLKQIGYSLSKVISLPGKESSFSIYDLSHILNIKIEKVPEYLSWVREKIH